MKADGRIDETPSSPSKIRKAAARLSGRKSDGFCYLNAELLKVGVAVILGMHLILTDVLQCSAISSYS